MIADWIAEGAAAPAHWLYRLMWSEEPALAVAHAVLILSLVIAAGLALGQVRVFKISLGVAGILFARPDSALLAEKYRCGSTAIVAENDPGLKQELWCPQLRALKSLVAVRGVKMRFHQPDYSKLDSRQAAIGSFAAPH